MSGKRRQVLERWICQMEMMARMQAGGGGGPQKKGRGRPGSGQNPPNLEVKRGGTDSVVRESEKAFAVDRKQRRL